MTAQFPPAAGGAAAGTALDELVLPLGAGNLTALLASSSIPFTVANRARGCRVVVPATGTLHDLSVYMSTSAQSAPGAHIDLGIYSTDAGTRELVWHSGSLTPTPDDAWFTVDPDLAVSAGDQLDLAVVADATTLSFAVCSLPEGQAGVLPAAWLAAGAAGAPPKLCWQASNAFPLPDTLVEGSCALASIVPALIARVA